MIAIASMLWDANEHSGQFSSCYDESWVEKLYRGVARNLTQPFRFILWTDRERQFYAPIEQRFIQARRPDFSSCIEPYSYDGAMIVFGLDTIVCGNIDHFADYALAGNELAVPRDPIYTDIACNAVALVPAGKKAVMYDRWRNENDMEWVRDNPHVFIDDMWPGQVLSHRVQIRGEGHVSQPTRYPPDLRICYFHGRGKPHELEADGFIQRHWC